MTARRLEEFIGLIETAERVSARRDSGSVYPQQTAGTSRSGPFSELGADSCLSPTRSQSSAPPWTGPGDLGSSHGSCGVPRLALPSWTCSPTPARFVGVPASHCGLSSVSALSTARETEQVSLGYFSLFSFPSSPSPLSRLQSAAASRPAKGPQQTLSAAPQGASCRPLPGEVLRSCPASCLPTFPS